MSRGFDSIRRRLRPAALLVLTLLASCGGGERVSTFRPGRVFVFGDETNVIVGASSAGSATGTVTDVDGVTTTALAGAKYTVNGLELDAAAVPTGKLSCGTNGLWHQIVSNYFGIGYAECNPFAGNPAGTIYAQVRARIADVAAQVSRANTVQGAFVRTDLVMIMVGQRDVLEDAYPTYTGSNADAVVALAEASGRRLGDRVNAIANAGAKVLIATLPNQGSTPFAVAQAAIGAERPALLQRMTERFNAGMRGTILNDGTKIGLVQADEQVQLVVNNPAVFAYLNTTSAACTVTVALPNCTTSTLVANATAANFVWADDRHLNVDANVRVGNLAVTRAANNPF